MAIRSTEFVDKLPKAARVSLRGSAIVPQEVAAVKQNGNQNRTPSNTVKSRRRRGKTRRQSHGSAWHWKQTDSWYYTLPGCKKRVPLFDEDGNRIRGVDNKKAAQLALARVKLGQGWRPEAPPASPDEWIVAKVCSEYLQYCERGVANGTVSKGHRDGTDWMLNDLCKFCGALPVAQLKKGHVKELEITSHQAKRTLLGRAPTRMETRLMAPSYFCISGPI